VRGGARYILLALSRLRSYEWCMFQRSRATLEATQGIREAAIDIAAALKVLAVREVGGDDLERRLQAIELSRAKWEAEMEGALLKATSTYKAAAASESRARTMVKSYGSFFENGNPEGEETVEETAIRLGVRVEDLPGGHAGAGESEPVQRLHVAVETAKARAVRAKFS